jgi:hypothetical protein
MTSIRTKKLGVVAILFALVTFLVFLLYLIVTAVQHTKKQTVDPSVNSDSTYPIIVNKSTSSDSVLPLENTPVLEDSTAGSSNTMLQRLSNRWTITDGKTFVGTTTKDYSIVYVYKWNYYNIAIVTEPVGQYRKIAEEELITALGMSRDTICDLPIYVQRTTAENDFGFELIGLSFCPGSVDLE